MKIKIASTIPLKQRWLDEVIAFIPGVVFEIVQTKELIETYWNEAYKSYYGDFNSVRAIVNSNTSDARVYIMSYKQSRALKITNHLALYDSNDRDGVLDTYIALDTRRLDSRAKANGFKSNFAWEICHELTHGREQNLGREYLNGDRTHEWEAQGRLKELWMTNTVGILTLLKEKLYMLLAQQNKDLRPLVKRKAEAIVDEMAKKGHAVRIVQGYRSIEEQNKLYAQGRTTPGAVVTNAKGGESFHNYGVAVDFVFRIEGYNATESLWQLLAKVGKDQGFEWGGDWKGFVDKPHFEMKLGYTLSDFQKGKVDYSKFV